MTRNGSPPTEIWVPMSVAPSPRFGRRRRAEDCDAEVGRRRSGRSGTCPARRRRPGPSDRPLSFRRHRVVVVVVPAAIVRLVEISGATPPIARQLADGRRVVERQRVGRAVVGRRDRQQVRSEAGEAAGDVRGRALADADEGDHRGHADDHAEHRQRGTQAARPEDATGRGEAARGSSCDDLPVAKVDLTGRGRGHARDRG